MYFVFSSPGRELAVDSRVRRPGEADSQERKPVRGGAAAEAASVANTIRHDGETERDRETDRQS